MENNLEHRSHSHGKVYHQTSSPGSDQRKTRKSPGSDANSCTHSDSSESSSPPTMLEVLGEHLYIKIEEMPELFRMELDVAKITGVLLELGEQQVLRLLQDEALLEQSVHQVIQHVPGVCTATGHSPHDVERVKNDSDTDLGDEERLYDQVCRLEPELGTHITGMLLEMGGSQVRSLLQSPTRLAQAVDRAKAACLQHRQSPHHHSPDQSMVDGLGHNGANSAGEAACSAECMAGAVDRNGESLRGEWKQRYGECEVAEGGARCAEVVDNELTEEEVGELVYAEAVRLYPESAAKLTGMVLDRGKSWALKLLQDTAQLHKAFHVAYKSIPQAER